MEELLKTKNYFSAQKLENETIEQTILRLLKSRGKAAKEQLYKLLDESLAQRFIAEATVTEGLEKEVIDYIAFNVFGCTLSTDIDIICQVAKREDVCERADIRNRVNLPRLKAELAELGYDSAKSLDINLVYVVKGNLATSNRGGKETQNIVYNTYLLHKQKYPCIFTQGLEIDPHDYMSVAAKYATDNLKILIGQDNYSLHRQERKNFYKSGWDRLVWIAKVLEQSLTKVTDRDVFKSLTMKLIQTIVAFKLGQGTYTKADMSKLMGRIYDERWSNVAMSILTRRPDAREIEFVRRLLADYIILAQSSSEQVEWHQHLVEVKAQPVGLLSTADVDAFLESPLEATEKFIKLMDKFSDRDQKRLLNDIFIGDPCTREENIPACIAGKCLLMRPRSLEWCERLHLSPRYGEDLGLSPCPPDQHWAKYYYNIIRGAILESIVTRNLTFVELLPNSWEKIQVGFLSADPLDLKSETCAPDLLLYNRPTNEIIPVEIKCIPSSFAKNRTYFRAVDMATLQLKNVAKIIPCTRGIITIVSLNAFLHFEFRSALINLLPAKSLLKV